MEGSESARMRGPVFIKIDPKYLFLEVTAHTPRLAAFYMIPPRGGDRLTEVFLNMPV